MRIENVNLHNLNISEALEKARKNISWCIGHGVPVIVLNHGRGLHSGRGFSVIKLELRKYLQDLPELASAGYKIVYGESDLPIALTFNEGNTLLVQKDLLHAYIGGAAVQEKNRRIFSPEGRQERKTQKRQRAGKHRRS